MLRDSLVLRSVLSSAAILGALLLSAGCASGWVTSSHTTTIDTGPEISTEIRGALTDGETRSVVVIDGERAYWIGGRALPQETTEFIDALLASPTSSDVRDYVRAAPETHRPQVLRFDPDTVLAFRQAAAIVEFGIWTGDEAQYLRVIRAPTREGHRYDVLLRERDDSDRSHLQRLDATPRLDAAWAGLAAGADTASPSPMSGSPFTVMRVREPLSNGFFRDVGIDFRGVD